jgi:hypothetical protein
MGEIVKFPSDDDSGQEGGPNFDQHLDVNNMTQMLNFLASLAGSDK